MDEAQAEPMRLGGLRGDAGAPVDPDFAAVGATAPARILISVLLPAPFSPISASISPASRLSEASRSGDGAAIGLRRGRAIESRFTPQRIG